jgi:hypothetical protein
MNEIVKVTKEELLVTVKYLCQNTEGLYLVDDAELVVLKYRAEMKVPLTITFSLTPTVLLGEVQVDDESEAYYIKIMRLGSELDRPAIKLGVLTLVDTLRESYIVFNDSLSSDQEDTPEPEPEQIVEIKKITAVNVLGTRQVTDVVITCEDDRPMHVTLASETADKFRVGALVIRDSHRLELYDKGTYVH